MPNLTPGVGIPAHSGNLATVTVKVSDGKEVKALLKALDEFLMGVGLFAPGLLDMPAFIKLYDARQDVASLK